MSGWIQAAMQQNTIVPRRAKVKQIHAFVGNSTILEPILLHIITPTRPMAIGCLPHTCFGGIEFLSLLPSCRASRGSSIQKSHTFVLALSSSEVSLEYLINLWDLWDLLGLVML